MMPADTGYAEVLSALKLLFPPGRVIEIRIIGEDGIASGYFDDPEKAAKEILARSPDPRISGIYVTLNEVNPVLLARRANRIKTRIGKKDATTADADILRRWYLPIDIDPVRVSGVSSSESEHADALVLADTIRTWLSDLGWPGPIIADSGNGAHLLYPIDLPNDEESRNLVRSVLKVLNTRFSDSRCKVDTANFNASRIWKVYGTISRKGDNLPDRPHRRSRIISAPSVPGLVSEQDLRVLGAVHQVSGEHSARTDTSNAKKPEVSGAHTLDLASWLSSHGLTSTAKPYQGGTLFSLDRCPFSDAHSDGAFAIQFANGAIFAGCHHDSCGGGTQRWPELKARFDPQSEVGVRLARLRSDRIRERHEAEGRGEPARHPQSPAIEPVSAIPDEEDPVSDAIQARSREVLAEGSPLSFLLETFASYHEGDQTVAECLLHSLASRSVINSKGLHVSITGESGKGKSHAIDTMRSLIPEEFRLEGRMSDKALFYMEGLRPGTVISLDDVSLSDQMQEILKGVTTSFQKPFPYRTVNTDRKPQTCTIPERCVWWIAKVEGAGDDQVFNRMLTCWIDDSEEQDLKVLDRTLGQAEQMPESLVQVSEEVRVCRQIWGDLDPVWVVIPFARRIRFQSAENRRNPDMLLDLIRTNAALCQQQREMIQRGGVACVVATEDDFNQAARLFVALNGQTGGQGTKLTKRESSLISALASMNRSEVTIHELQRVTGLSNSTVVKLLHGYRSYGKSYSGLLEKCPAVSFLDRTVTSGDEGCTTLRRARVYLWDAALYFAWVKGGSVWLADDRDDEDPDTDTPPDPPDGVTLRHQDGNGSLQPEETVEIAFAGSHGAVSYRFGEVSEEEDRSDTACAPAGVSLSSISPLEYVRIDGLPDRHRCCVCGKRPTQYQERMSAKRLQGPPRSNLMLCSSCYTRAVSRTAASVIPLPGVIDTGQMIRRSSSIGRCHLCDLRPAVWSDPASRTNLCDSCYQRNTQGNNPDSLRGSGPP